MKKLFDKDEVTFAIIFIVAYVVGMSIADSVSESLGIIKSVTIIYGGVLSAVLFAFAKKNGLMEYYGLCRGETDIKKMLFFLPMIAAGTVNLWEGVSLKPELTIAESLLSAGSMIFVGFLEEMVFRGFLFKAMCRTNIKSAVIVSSVTFGIGHIVNLLNGRDIAMTLIQVVYAVAIGFMLTGVFLKTGTLIPCIIFHSFVNSTSIFSPDSSNDILFGIIVGVISAAYSIYIFKAFPENRIAAEEKGE